jgi:hypothetical protein
MRGSKPIIVCFVYPTFWREPTQLTGWVYHRLASHFCSQWQWFQSGAYSFCCHVNGLGLGPLVDLAIRSALWCGFCHLLVALVWSPCRFILFSIIFSCHKFAGWWLRISHMMVLFPFREIRLSFQWKWNLGIISNFPRLSVNFQGKYIFHMSISICFGLSHFQGLWFWALWSPILFDPKTVEPWIDTSRAVTPGGWT